MFRGLYLKKITKKFCIQAVLVLCISIQGISQVNGASRLKDIADFEGIRDNLLVGYGLVVGLNNTGDTLSNGHFTKQSLLAMLERLGVKPTEAGLTSKNVAAVMVTASLPGFTRQGSRIDVVISALGDSKNLLGGTLLVTPLLGADGEVYAVAQGQVAVGVKGGRGSFQKLWQNGRVQKQSVGLEKAPAVVVRLI